MARLQLFPLHMKIIIVSLPFYDLLHHSGLSYICYIFSILYVKKSELTIVTIELSKRKGKKNVSSYLVHVHHPDAFHKFFSMTTVF